MHKGKYVSKLAGLNIATLLLVGTLQVIVPQASASGLNQAVVRIDRMKAATATGGEVCATPHTTATEASVKVTFPLYTGGDATKSFTVNSTAANWTVTTTNLPADATAWPGIDTATDVTGNTVTFPSTDLTVATKYCFNFSGTSTLTTGVAANDLEGSVATYDGAGTPAVIDNSNVALSVVSNDQIVVSAVVPPMFSMTLPVNTDSFTAPLSATSTTATSGTDVTIATNANSGWVAWVKSANAALTSASTGKSIATYGTVNEAATDLATLSATNAYNLDVAIKTDSATAGTGTVSQGVGYGQEYAGANATSGGTLTTVFQPIASADGVTDGDVLTLKELARITSLQQAATDYTDTLTVVAAGRF